MVLVLKFIPLAFQRKLRILFVPGLFALLLSSCVTTEMGGFSPDTSDAEALDDYIQLATAYYNQDDMANARRHINNALAIDDRNSEIYNVLALVYQSEGDLEIADETFRRAISLDSSNSRARNNYAAFLFSQERFEAAVEQLKVVTIDTAYEGRAMAFENLGRSALQVNQLIEAESAFQRALQLNPNLYLPALELAKLNFDRGDFTSARRLYRQFLTNKDFYGLPHSPSSLWLGIQIERIYENEEVAEGYARVLSTLYNTSPEYREYRNSLNEN